MKKTNTKIEQDEMPEKKLAEGATCLLECCETPVMLLEFLTESLRWVDLYNTKNEEKKEDSYFQRMMIETIAIPWLKKESDTKKLIVSALKDLHDTFGHEGYHEHISAIIQGFAIDLEEKIPFDLKRKYFLMFATMYEIGDSIADYETELYLFEQKKLTEAA